MGCVCPKKWRIAILVFFIGISPCFSQAYRPYNQKFDLGTKISRDFIGLRDNDRSYKPNTPLSAGLGFSLNNTIINIFLGYGLDDTIKENIGKTDFFDLQFHNYGRRFMVDLFFQQYRGFYSETDGLIMVYPDLSVRQCGAEVSYLINANKFSAKAAFGHTEQQLESGGSFIAGIGAYFNQIEYDGEVFSEDKRLAHNLRAGASFGYAYSFVLSERWLLAGALTCGAQIGNNAGRTHEGDLSANLANLFRFSIGYSVDNWCVSLDFIGNTQYYGFFGDNAFSLISGNLGIKYLRRFYGAPFFLKNGK
ncbi:MAG: DUF4421 domain-containing protein [Treponema sp.]|jgi:hypothetical protein|nr:DUF4421 domain-containing protein [Treponema sp.]